MPEVEAVDKLLSIVPRKRFGKFNQLGMHQLGFSDLGDSDIYFLRVELGVFTLGVDFCGELILLSGIYRTDNVTGRTKFYREPYYITRNPRTDKQQTHRQKYGQAVEAWRGLTDEERVAYNKRAKRLHISGWNLFYKEFLND